MYVSVPIGIMSAEAHATNASTDATTVNLKIDITRTFLSGMFPGLLFGSSIKERIHYLHYSLTREKT